LNCSGPDVSGANESQVNLARILKVQKRWLDPAASEISRMADILRDKTVPDSQAYAQAALILDRLPGLADRLDEKALADLFFSGMAESAAAGIKTKKGIIKA